MAFAAWQRTSMQLPLEGVLDDAHTEEYGAPVVRIVEHARQTTPSPAAGALDPSATKAVTGGTDPCAVAPTPCRDGVGDAEPFFPHDLTT